MISILLHIPVLFGVSVEVYFILLVIGVTTYFFWKFFFKRHIKVDKRIKFYTWITTILVTLGIYLGVMLLSTISQSYYPNRNFNQQEWLSNKDNRYEFSDKLIKKAILIGKSKPDVRQILGNESGNVDSIDTWNYELGVKPEIGSIDPSYLYLEFRNNKVINVWQTK